MGELVDDAEHAELPPVVGAVLDEVVGPDMVLWCCGRRRMQEPSLSQSRPRLGRRRGTLSPSRRQIRSTRFRFTVQPADRSIAVIRR